MIKVSILIPIYGVEKYLPHCVISVLSQTLKDIEIILIDDGSKDNSSKICDEFAKKDKRIKVIHKKNSGYGDSLNHGIKLAKGKYIAIVDADDWIEPNMYHTLYDISEKNKLDIVKGDFYRYSEITRQDSKENYISDEISEKMITVTSYPILLEKPSIWAGIYNKDFLIKNKISFLTTPGASYQDTSFHIKTLLMAQKVMFINKAFYHYRQDNVHASVKDTGKVFCVCDEWSEIIQYLKQNKKYQALAPLLCLLQFNTYYWNLKRLSGRNQREFLWAFSQEFRKFQAQNILQKNLFKKKQYKQLMRIINSPILFQFTTNLKHLPKQFINLFRRKYG